MRRSSPRSQYISPRMRVRLGVFASLLGSKLHFSAPGRGVEREHAQLRRRRVEHAVRDDRLALHLGALERVARVVGPGDLQRARRCPA